MDNTCTGLSPRRLDTLTDLRLRKIIRLLISLPAGVWLRETDHLLLSAVSKRIRVVSGEEPP